MCAGDDMRPSPPLEYAKTLSLYTLPGINFVTYVSNLFPIDTIVSLAVLMSWSFSQTRTYGMTSV